MTPRPLRRFSSFRLTAWGGVAAFAGLAWISPTGLRADAGTSAQREQLFNLLVKTSEAREAWAPIKEQRLGFDWARDLAALRADFLGATDDDALYYALIRASNTRRDRHLSVTPVPGGLRPWFVREGLDYEHPPETPLHFLTDFSDGSAFVSSVATNHPFAAGAAPQPGDVVERVNGLAWADYAATVRPYLRHSSEIGFRWHLTLRLAQRHPDLPRDLAPPTLQLSLRRADGRLLDVAVPYGAANDWTWSPIETEPYPGFHPVMETSTYDLYRHATRPTLLIVWKGFREKMQPDVDLLVGYAESEGVLGYDLLWDGTGSRGGSAGAYAIQRLLPKPFKTTFGNLRISDITPAFIAQKEQQFATHEMDDGGVPETIDDGSWLMDWLRTDVTQGMAAGQRYTNNVPFKSAHAPKWSDGILSPAPVHFTGRFVVLLGPKGGSHLDQFASIIKDNAAGPIIGMTAGGYSNTWEWEEILMLPGTATPLATYMWDIGHSIRPNGQVLEGNPAEPDVPLPLTRANFDHYHAELITAGLKWLDENPR